MDHDAVMAWVQAYEDGWRGGDLQAVGRLFSPDVAYRKSPYEPDIVGHDGVRGFWLVDGDEPFTVRAEPVAVDGDRAVVRLEVRYGDPVRQEYRDLWLLHFASDGRVDDFEEWAYWPGQRYTAADD